jgi:hypothetical protein
MIFKEPLSSGSLNYRKIYTLIRSGAPDKILSYFEFYRIDEMAFLGKNTVKQFTVFVLPSP